MGQQIPELTPGMTAACRQCGTALLRTARHGLNQSVALVFAALVLLVVMSTNAMMSVSTSGIEHSAYLLSGPAELVERNMAMLAVVVTLVTLVIPFVRLTGLLYVLLSLRQVKLPADLNRIFALTERLRPWSMVEVFVFGVFVAYVKLGDLVRITLDPGVYALLALTFVLIWADSSLDREAVWERIAPEKTGPDPSGKLVGCEVCGHTDVPRPPDARCARCLSRVHHRKPDSLSRTWALLIASVVLYIPANYYPVLTIVQLGAGTPATIIGGVEELLSSGLYPLAALVFFASVAVPMLKMVGLAVMLVAVQAGRTEWLRDRTRMYYLIRGVGRWSMIDIFMESLLGALVKFGTVVTIEPGMGAVAFCGVVILTMLAAEAFDPRLMWDAAGRREANVPQMA
jgi:paraquat-inducible protein A